MLFDVKLLAPLMDVISLLVFSIDLLRLVVMNGEGACGQHERR